MSLEVDDGNINNHVKVYSQKLVTDELQQLQKQQILDAVEHIGSPDEDSVEGNAISTSKIKPMLTKWQYVSEVIEKYRPEKVATVIAATLFNDIALMHFHSFLKGMKSRFSFFLPSLLSFPRTNRPIFKVS